MDESTIGDFPLPRLIARGSLIQPTEHAVIYEPPQRLREREIYIYIYIYTYIYTYIIYNIYIIDSTWKPLGLGFH